MKFRVFLLGLAILACIVLNSMIEVGQPTVDATIAVDQLKDSETAALTMRGFNRFANQVPLISWGVVSLFGLILFYNRLVMLAKRAWANLGED